MQGSLDEPPIVIRSSGLRSFLLMIACGIAATFCGLALFASPSPPSRAAGGLVAFGLGAPYFAWRLIRPDILTLSPDGLVWQSRWRTTQWSWRDVSRFRAVRVHIASRYVGFDLADGVSTRRSYTNYDVSYAGANASVGGGWEIAPDRLAELLNAARAQWAGSGGTQRPGASE